MTRAHFGLVLLCLAYLASGYSLLYATGLVRSLTSAIRLAGLSLFGGFALLGTTLATAVAFGFEPTVWFVAVAVIGLVAAGVAAGRTTAPVPLVALPNERGRLARVSVIAGAALLLLALISAVARAATAAADGSWDVWDMWIPKGMAIYYYGGLDTGIGGYTTEEHVDYPPLVPAVLAATFHLMGGVNTPALPLAQCLIGIAFILSLLALLRPYVPSWLLFPSLAALTLAPAFWWRLGSMLPDQTVGCLLALAAVLGLLWLEERRSTWLVLAVVFLAAASVTKNEGMFLALTLALTMLIAALIVHRRSGLAAAALLLGPAAIIPWKLWLRQHGFADTPGDYRLSDVLDPGYLADRTDRLQYAAEEMLQFLFLDYSQWRLVTPLAIIALVVAARRLPVPSIAMLVWLIVAFVGLATVYWISFLDVMFYVGTSMERVVSTLPLVAVSVAPLLLGLALRREQGVGPGSSS